VSCLPIYTSVGFSDTVVNPKQHVNLHIHTYSPKACSHSPARMNTERNSIRHAHQPMRALVYMKAPVETEPCQKERIPSNSERNQSRKRSSSVVHPAYHICEPPVLLLLSSNTNDSDGTLAARCSSYQTRSSTIHASHHILRNALSRAANSLAFRALRAAVTSNNCQAGVS